MITALALAALAAVVGLAYVAITRTDMARAADVRAADLAADLKVAEGNVESWRRAAQRQAARAEAHRKVTNALREHPLLLADPAATSGLDQLSAALDFAADLTPNEPPRSGGDNGAVGGVPEGPADRPDPERTLAALGGGDARKVPQR